MKKIFILNILLMSSVASSMLSPEMEHEAEVKIIAKLEAKWRMEREAKLDEKHQAEIEQIGYIYRKLEKITSNLWTTSKNPNECKKLPEEIGELTKKIKELSSYYGNRTFEGELATALRLMVEGEISNLVNDLAKNGHEKMLAQSPEKLRRINLLIGEAHGIVHALHIKKNHISAKKLKLHGMRASL